MIALSIALDDADADKLVAAVEEFAETRAPVRFRRSSRNERHASPNHRVAYFNGRIVPEREVVMPFRDRGFKYGDAAFDMTRTFNGPAVQAARSMSSGSTARCAICGSTPASARRRWSRSARRCWSATATS